jgi:hypothetical protein
MAHTSPRKFLTAILIFSYFYANAFLSFFATTMMREVSMLRRLPILLLIVVLGGCSFFRPMMPGYKGPQKPGRNVTHTLDNIAYRIQVILDGEKADRVFIPEITLPDGTISNLGRYLGDDLLSRLNTKKRPALPGWPDSTVSASGETIVVRATVEDKSSLFLLRVQFYEYPENTRLGGMEYEIANDLFYRRVDSGIDLPKADTVEVIIADPRFAGEWMLQRNEPGIYRECPMTLYQTRNVVTGGYDWFSGKINGKAKEKRLTLQWYQVDNGRSGTGYLILKDSGDEMIGRWGYGKSTSYKWHAIRVKPAGE